LNDEQCVDKLKELENVTFDDARRVKFSDQVCMYACMCEYICMHVCVCIYIYNESFFRVYMIMWRNLKSLRM
jgi:hypothetical protein